MASRVKQRWSGRLAGTITKLKSGMQKNATKEAEYEEPSNKAAALSKKACDGLGHFAILLSRDGLLLGIYLQPSAKNPAYALDPH